MDNSFDVTIKFNAQGQQSLAGLRENFEALSRTISSVGKQGNVNLFEDIANSSRQMASSIQTLVSQMNRLTSLLAKTAVSGTQSFRQMNTALNDLRTNSIRTTAEMTRGFENVNRAVRNASGTSFTTINNNIQQMGRSLNAASNYAELFSRRFGRSIAGILTGIVSVQTATKLLHEGFQVLDRDTSALGKLAVVFEGASEGQLEGQLQAIKDVANEMGVSYDAAIKGYTSLAVAQKKFGESSATIQESFTDLMKLSTSLRLSSEASQRLFYSVQQGYNKTKIQAEELNQQFGELVPGGVSTAIEALKDDFSDLALALKKGQVSAKYWPKILKAISQGMNDAYLRNINTLQAQIIRMGNAWDDLVKYMMKDPDFQSGLVEAIKEISDFLRSDTAKKGMKAVADAIAYAIQLGMSFARTLVSVGEALDNIVPGGLGDVLKALVSIQAVLFILGTLTSAFVQIRQAAAFTGLLGSAAGETATKFGLLGNVTRVFTADVGTLASRVVGLVTSIRGLTLVLGVMMKMLGVGILISFISALVDAAGGVDNLKNTLKDLVGVSEKTWDDMGAHVKDWATYAIAIVETVGQAMAKTVQAAVAGLTVLYAKYKVSQTGDDERKLLEGQVASLESVIAAGRKRIKEKGEPDDWWDIRDNSAQLDKLQVKLDETKQKLASLSGDNAYFRELEESAKQGLKDILTQNNNFGDELERNYKALQERLSGINKKTSVEAKKTEKPAEFEESFKKQEQALDNLSKTVNKTISELQRLDKALTKAASDNDYAAKIAEVERSYAKLKDSIGTLSGDDLVKAYDSLEGELKTRVDSYRKTGMTLGQAMAKGVEDGIKSVKLDVLSDGFEKIEKEVTDLSNKIRQAYVSISQGQDSAAIQKQVDDYTKQNKLLDEKYALLVNIAKLEEQVSGVSSAQRIASLNAELATLKEISAETNRRRLAELELTRAINAQIEPMERLVNISKMYSDLMSAGVISVSEFQSGVSGLTTGLKTQLGSLMASFNELSQTMDWSDSGKVQQFAKLTAAIKQCKEELLNARYAAGEFSAAIEKSLPQAFEDATTVMVDFFEEVGKGEKAFSDWKEAAVDAVKQFAVTILREMLKQRMQLMSDSINQLINDLFGIGSVSLDGMEEGVGKATKDGVDKGVDQATPNMTTEEQKATKTATQDGILKGTDAAMPEFEEKIAASVKKGVEEGIKNAEAEVKVGSQDSTKKTKEEETTTKETKKTTTTEPSEEAVKAAQEASNDTISNVGDVLEGVSNDTTDMVKDVGDVLEEATGSVSDAAGTVADAAGVVDEESTSIFGKIGDFFSGIWDSISSFFSNMWDGITSFFGDFDFFGIFEGWGDTISGWFSGFDLSGLLGGWGDTISGWFSGFDLSGLLGGWGDTISGWFSGFDLSGLLGGWGDSITGFFSGIGDFFGNLFGGMGSFFGGFFHQGGIVGHDIPSRKTRMSPLAWIDAPRYHSGGFAGIRPDEYPAILQRNEEILAANDPRNSLNRANGTTGQPSMNLEIVNTLDSQEVLSNALSSVGGRRILVNAIQTERSRINSVL